MEFKINKIEMDVRHKINEERSMDKVHTKKGIGVNKDKELTKEEIEENERESKKLKNGNDENDKKDNQNNNKNENEESHKGVDPNRGHFIDIKR